MQAEAQVKSCKMNLTISDLPTLIEENLETHETNPESVIK